MAAQPIQNPAQPITLRDLCEIEEHSKVFLFLSRAPIIGPIFGTYQEKSLKNQITHIRANHEVNTPNSSLLIGLIGLKNEYKKAQSTSYVIFLAALVTVAIFSPSTVAGSFLRASLSLTACLFSQFKIRRLSSQIIHNQTAIAELESKPFSGLTGKAQEERSNENEAAYQRNLLILSKIK